ncbi:MAG: SDR family oxidoreductase [bacterium]|nr:SDR family oxidoreductase [bacterium]
MTRVALVQGASRGLGLAFVRALLERPDVDRVVATSRAPDRSEALATLGETHGAALDLLALDVRDEASIALAASTLTDRGIERLHTLVNCAGVLHEGAALGPEKRLEAIDPDRLRTVFEVNAFGPILVAKHLLPKLRHDERAVIANLSARVGSIEDNRLGGWYAYRASKSAQNMFTRTLAIELRRRATNVICLALHPGTVDTDLSRPFQGGVPPEKRFAPERAAAQLLAVMDGATPEDSGGFFAWDGAPIPF